MVRLQRQAYRSQRGPLAAISLLRGVIGLQVDRVTGLWTNERDNWNGSQVSGYGKVGCACETRLTYLQI
jgi:hypothetical protein